MYQPKFWLIKLKNQPADLQKYTTHIVAETQEDARRIAESLHGEDALEQDPILDPPSQ